MLDKAKTAEKSRMSTCIRCRGEVVCYDMGWPPPLLVCDKCKTDAKNNTLDQWVDLIYERRVVSSGYYESSRTIRVIVEEILAVGAAKERERILGVLKTKYEISMESKAVTNE